MEWGQEEQGEKAVSASNSRHEAAAGSPELLTRIRELETQLSDAYSAFSRLEKVCMGFEENIAHARAERDCSSKNSLHPFAKGRRRRCIMPFWPLTICCSKQ